MFSGGQITLGRGRSGNRKASSAVAKQGGGDTLDMCGIAGKMGREGDMRDI